MRKNHFLFLLFGVLLIVMQPHSCFSQRNKTQRIYLGYDSWVSPNKSLKSGNLQLTLFPEDKWSLNYSIGFGVSNNDNFYAHYPMGAFWGIYLLANSSGGSSDLLATLAVISFLIPEGVSYNIKVNDKLNVSPYLNFNSMEFYYNDLNEEKIKPSLGLGARISYSMNKHFGCSFGLGGKIISAEGWGIQSGVSLYYQY